MKENNLTNNNMNKEFIPYAEALALKELGFDEECFSFYNTTEMLISSEFLWKNSYSNGADIVAPLYQQAFRWLYQKLDIEKGVMPLYTESQQLLLKELIDKVSSKHLLV